MRILCGLVDVVEKRWWSFADNGRFDQIPRRFPDLVMVCVSCYIYTCLNFNKKYFWLYWVYVGCVCVWVFKCVWINPSKDQRLRTQRRRFPCASRIERCGVGGSFALGMQLHWPFVNALPMLMVRDVLLDRFVVARSPDSVEHRPDAVAAEKWNETIYRWLLCRIRCVRFRELNWFDCIQQSWSCSETRARRCSSTFLRVWPKSP